MTQSELQLKANDLRDSIAEAVIKFNKDTGLTPNIDIITFSADTISSGNQFINVSVKVNVDI